MANWKTVLYQNTQQTGPAHAIDEVCKDLKKKKIAYEAFDFDLELADGVTVEQALKPRTEHAPVVGEGM
jgi:hypothetical protein